MPPTTPNTYGSSSFNNHHHLIISFISLPSLLLRLHWSFSNVRSCGGGDRQKSGVASSLEWLCRGATTVHAPLPSGPQGSSELPVTLSAFSSFDSSSRDDWHHRPQLHGRMTSVSSDVSPFIISTCGRCPHYCFFLFSFPVQLSMFPWWF